MPQLLLCKRILDDCLNTHLLLEEACKTLPITRLTSEAVTGEIRSSDAFKRYINTSIELGLAQKISGRLYNTKRGEILAALSEDKGNVFLINQAQSYLFLKILIEKDYDYLTSLVYALRSSSNQEHEAFFTSLSELWQKKLVLSSSIRNVKLYDQLKTAVNTHWDVPDRYFKEIVKGPRLEWLLDSNAIEHWNMKNNSISFIGDIDQLFNSNETNFSMIFAHYRKKATKKPVIYWSDFSTDERTIIIDSLLVKAFEIFKTNDALPKISVNQFLEYCMAVLSEQRIVCEISEFDHSLEEYVQSITPSYRYVKINSEVDRGYISKHV
jgi:hypothetical protein